MSSLKLVKGCSPVMGEFMFFHDKALTLLILMALLVAGLIVQVLRNSVKYKSFVDQKILEFFWTILPSFILLFLALPSLKLLYYIDVSSEVGCSQTMKSVGHQWYWSKSFFFKNEEVESDMYMVKTPDLVGGDFRGLETDSVMVAPVKEVLRLIVTSEDVIHSFAIPSLGLKIDAVPGRINQQFFFSDVVGVFYGQCSEICGSNHSFMPMTLEVFSKKLY